jgi:AraC-like DNA-binding protein
MQTVILSRPCGVATGWPPAVEAPLRHSTLRPVHSFSTAPVEPARQFDAWHAQCGTFMELTAPLNHHVGYQAQCTAWKLGPFVLTSATAQAARYRRTRTQIRRDAIDHWVIKLSRSGMHRMWTATDFAVIPAGLPFVFSLANAFEGERSDLEWISLFVPRDIFPGLAPVIDRSLHMPLASSLGLLLGRYLDALDAQLLCDTTEAELPRLVAATRAMVAACIAPSREAAVPLLEHARLERVRRAIRQNLRSPTLTPKRLCRLVGMSRSQLYRLFEPMGGVACYIQAERLREAHRALADPDILRDIREVAEDLGFFDASAFSRTFRREFGCTPSEVRAAALAGAGDIPLRRPPPQASSDTFTAVLRMLQ